MSKSNQQLNPENYIRQKARNLPLHKCYITANWKDTGMSTVVVSRRHTNGNLTFGVYQVDLYCLGIRETIYYFNESETDFNRIVEEFTDELELIEADYTLVHNVIYAAHEYAAEFNIQPHKNFSVSKFILEEDSDDIPLIDIVCGFLNKPLLVYDESFSQQQLTIIIKKLEDAVGKDGFGIVKTNDEDWDTDEYQELYTEYVNMQPQERELLYRRLAEESLTEYSDENFKKREYLSEAIFMYDLSDEYTTENLIKKWKPELARQRNNDWFSPGFLGFIDPVTPSNDDRAVLEQFHPFNKATGSEEQHKSLIELRNRLGRGAFLSYFEWRWLNFDNIELNDLLVAYPDYPLFNLLAYENKLSKLEAENDRCSGDFDRKRIELPEMEQFFPDGYVVNALELYEYYSIKMQAIRVNMDINALEAIGESIYNDYSDRAIEAELEDMYVVSRIEMLDEYYGIDEY